MDISEELLATLRAVKNRFWAQPTQIEQCVRRGLVTVNTFGPELTEPGRLALRAADKPRG